MSEDNNPNNHVVQNVLQKALGAPAAEQQPNGQNRSPIQSILQSGVDATDPLENLREENKRLTAENEELRRALDCAKTWNQFLQPMTVRIQILEAKVRELSPKKNEKVYPVLRVSPASVPSTWNSIVAKVKESSSPSPIPDLVGQQDKDQPKVFYDTVNRQYFEKRADGTEISQLPSSGLKRAATTEEWENVREHCGKSDMYLDPWYKCVKDLFTDPNGDQVFPQKKTIKIGAEMLFGYWMGFLCKARVTQTDWRMLPEEKRMFFRGHAIKIREEVTMQVGFGWLSMDENVVKKRRKRKMDEKVEE